MEYETKIVVPRGIENIQIRDAPVQIEPLAIASEQFDCLGGKLPDNVLLDRFIAVNDGIIESLGCALNKTIELGVVEQIRPDFKRRRKFEFVRRSDTSGADQ